MRNANAVSNFGVPGPLDLLRDKTVSPDAIDLTQLNSPERVKLANLHVRFECSEASCHSSG